ncbi:hypothetical protein B0H14DRAFT_3540198 [Mycena olivaceomarginata]|nr:hypothetical protein B0H14DRAFT_3540198 [Mycena olivaceomarginata]
MSASSPTRSVRANVPFVFFNTPNNSTVGTDALLDDTDVVPTPGRPLLTVSPSEHGPSRVQPDANLWPPLYFLSHPAIYRLTPFVRVPARIPRTDPMYLATILDRAVPVFETLQRSYAFIPHSRAQLIVLAGLLRLVSAVSQIVPARVQSGWMAFLPSGEPATSPTWDTRPHIPFLELLIDEFRAGRLSSPTITHIIFNSIPVPHRVPALPRCTTPTGWSVSFPSLLIMQANRTLTTCPFMDMSNYDSMWYWWRRYRMNTPAPSQLVVRCADSTSPHYRPTLLHPYRLRPTTATPPPQTGPSAVWFRKLRYSVVAGQREEGHFLASQSIRDSRFAIPLRRDALLVLPCIVMALLALLLEARRLLVGPHPLRDPPMLLYVLFTLSPLLNKKGRPMIKLKSSQKSVTPPADEAYNEEGEEERDAEEEEEEEEEE